MDKLKNVGSNTDPWGTFKITMSIDNTISLFSICVSANRRRRDIKMPLHLSALEWKKYNIVSNNRGLKQNCGYFVLDRDYTFSANLVQKFNLIRVS